jgi:hypothetical protein
MKTALSITAAVIMPFGFVVLAGVLVAQLLSGQRRRRAVPLR